MPTKLPAIVKSQGFDPMFKWSESFIDSVRADFILLYPLNTKQQMLAIKPYSNYCNQLNTGLKR